MFGRGWEPGHATIVARKEIKSVGRHGGIDYGGAKMKSYEFVADVQPAGGGAVFRTVMHEPFDERVWARPGVGDVVPAICDPKRQKAKFDTQTVTAEQKAREKTRKTEDAARFDAMAKAAPGTAHGAIGSTPGSAEATASHRSGQPDPQLRRARVALREARRKGDSAEVDRLTAELDALEHGNTHAHAPNASGVQPIEHRLAHLQQLHDTGVLTLEEYTAQRQRILDSL